MPDRIKFIQVNLHHAKGASGILCRRFTKENLDMALIQEPWANNGKILGISTHTRKLLYDDKLPSPRAAILVGRDTKFLPITEFIKRDLVAIQVEVPTTLGKTEIIVASAYFPGDIDEVPPPEVTALINYCKLNNKLYIIGCDANAHHSIWGSTDINKRGECLLEYILSNNIDICNQGDTPTFVNAIREEVLDLTLCSPKLSEKINNWHVSEEISLSDHRQIMFNFNAGELVTEVYRDPRKTDWNKYVSTLSNGGNVLEMNIRTPQELERASTKFTQAIMTAFNDSCPIKKRSSNKDASWWNKKLEMLRKVTRKLFNRAKATRDWDQYKKALTEYNKELRKSRRKDWRFTCEKIESTPVVARLHKALSKDHTNGLGRLKKCNGIFTTNPSESLGVMMETHFPGSIIGSGDATQDSLTAQSGSNRNREEAQNIACSFFTRSKVEWAVNSFEPFKSPGMDGIFPALIQKASIQLVPSITELFRASITLGYIPTTWRQVRVIFIPKAGKRDKTLPKAYRPISLTSIMLKIMEKVIDYHAKTVYLKTSPLSKYQYAYQKNKSTIAALHMLITKIEKSLQAKEISLAAFLDIEGAFDNASHDSIKKAMAKHGFDKCIIEWIHAMLIDREISAKLGDTSLTVKTTKGCPQGGVLSPMLWSLVVDDLLTDLAANGFEVIGFADDVVIIVRGKYDSIISNRMQSALNLTLAWCSKEGLSINPSKTTVVPFTRKRNYTIANLHLNGIVIEISTQVKYLGVIIDQRLNWNAHLEQAIKKATSALWICSRTFGKQWGLKPRMIQWIYMAIVRPRITYASLVWWPKIKETSAQAKLNKLQRLACVSITGAMRSAPSKALEAMLYLLPLHQWVKLEAEKSALRLHRTKKIIEGDLTGHMSILKDFEMNPSVAKIEDWMEIEWNFEVPYKVIETDRGTWDAGGPHIRPGSIQFYTDGSKMGELTGAGVTGPGTNISIPMGHWPTVFQAEIQAILECTYICQARKYRHTNICIFSDSLAALKALKAFTCQSKLVWECIRSLRQLSRRNQVNLYWVPGHCGIEGNERADTLARHASSMQLLGPEPFCGVSSCALRMELKEWEKSKIEAIWRATTTARQSKRFILPNSKTSRNLLNLNKKDLSTITGFLTGHCPSRYHLTKLGKLQSDMCRFCNFESETSEHLLCTCSALFQHRLRFFGKRIVEPNEIWLANPSKVVSFIKDAIPNWEELQGQT